jgi:hypothetical protein
VLFFYFENYYAHGGPPKLGQRILSLPEERAANFSVKRGESFDFQVGKFLDVLLY